MTAAGVALLAALLAVLLALAWPLGNFIARVHSGRPLLLARWLAPLERATYGLAGIDADVEQDWRSYAAAMLWFNGLGIVGLFVLQLVQAWLPFNPGAVGAVPVDCAADTAISFVTNTNWQNYAGENTMSHLTQMAGLGVQNFLSAATGMAVLLALVRGLRRNTSATVGNFWVDLVRSTVYVLLPLSLLLAVLLLIEGTPQTLLGSVAAQSVDGGVPQAISIGPIASQEAIKMLGTNGGGFFNANSAHPYENPTFAANFLQMVAMLLLPAALCAMFGRMVGDKRQGVVLLLAMLVIFVPLALASLHCEQQGNPTLHGLGLDEAAGAAQAGGNMEGKEVRFGVASSSVFSVATTAVSCGAVNSMHDSFTPLGGLWPMWLMQLGEVVFGGCGSGLYGLLVFALVAAFLAGLMIGRTPEYLGKKLGAFEMKMVALAILLPCVMVLLGTAVAVATEAGRAGVGNPGAHGFSEILYAFSSAANNNGSAFGGLSGNTPFYNLGLAACMLVGRFGVAVPVLAIAGSLAQKRRIPPSAGTLPTHGPLFLVLVVAVVLLVGALTFLPALALGPIVEHLQGGH